MTIEEIKSLISQIDKSALTELVYEKDGEKLVLSKKQKVAPQPVSIMPQMGMMPPAGAFAGAASQMPAAAAAAAAAAPDGADKAAAKNDNVAEVRSPYIGTILLNADDSTVPLVNVGDRIKKGQKLCQIEAMKMYNDVVSPVDGTLLSIEVDQEDIVECDQLLFTIEKG
ncbi:MAG: hypothetical protein IJ123_03510 [Blautia sp.]|nr:hypothetical protein [Blautia sp.]